MAKTHRNCEYCSKDFEASLSKVTVGKARYCSHSCAMNARRTGSEITCQNCGKKFRANQSAINEGRKFCSKSCHYKSGYHLPIRSPKVSIDCATCGKSFDVYPYEIEEGKRYCSNPCRIEARKGKSRGGSIKKSCLSCGQEFTAFRANIENGGGKYCSRKCMGLAYRGTNSTSWRGGKGEYRGANWFQQRNLAHARDGGQCQICHCKPKKHQRSFDVHHITPFREFNGDYFTANDLSNLITLCVPCHRKAERGKIAVPKRLF